MANKQKLENPWFGAGVFGVLNPSLSLYKSDYAIVLSAHIYSKPSDNKTAEVTFELRRFSDGLEAEFKTKEDIECIIEFINSARKNASIDYLIDKTLNVKYLTYTNKVIAVQINKYAMPDD